MTTRTKPQRTMRLSGDSLRINDNGKEDTYKVTPIREDGCLIGCRFDKKGGDSYDVDLRDGVCHCWAGLRRGTCRHIAAAFKLKELGCI